MANDNFALGIGVVAGLGYLFTRMKDDKEEFREEEWYPRFYRERMALKKTRKQTKDAEMVYRKYKGRKGPALSATSVKRGTRRRGNDGNMWEVRKSGKSQRWFKGAESFSAEDWPTCASCNNPIPKDEDGEPNDVGDGTGRGSCCACVYCYEEMCSGDCEEKEEYYKWSAESFEAHETVCLMCGDYKAPKQTYCCADCSRYSNERVNPLGGKRGGGFPRGDIAKAVLTLKEYGGEMSANQWKARIRDVRPTRKELNTNEIHKLVRYLNPAIYIKTEGKPLTYQITGGNCYDDWAMERYQAESFSAELKRDSCCCGATKSNPCACMIKGVMECSAVEPKCPCYAAKNAESFSLEEGQEIPNLTIDEWTEVSRALGKVGTFHNWRHEGRDGEGGNGTTLVVNKRYGVFGRRNKYKCDSCGNEYDYSMFPDGFNKHEPISFCEFCLDKEGGEDVYGAESFDAEYSYYQRHKAYNRFLKNMEESGVFDDGRIDKYEDLCEKYELQGMSEEECMFQALKDMGLYEEMMEDVNVDAFLENYKAESFDAEDSLIENLKDFKKGIESDFKPSDSEYKPYMSVLNKYINMDGTEKEIIEKFNKDWDGIEDNDLWHKYYVIQEGVISEFEAESFEAQGGDSVELIAPILDYHWETDSPNTEITQAERNYIDNEMKYLSPAEWGARGKGVPDAHHLSIDIERDGNFYTDIEGEWNVDWEAESFEVEDGYVIVDRGNYKVRVHKKNLDRFNRSTMHKIHSDKHKEGLMYDEETMRWIPLEAESFDAEDSVDAWDDGDILEIKLGSPAIGVMRWTPKNNVYCGFSIGYDGRQRGCIITSDGLRHSLVLKSLSCDRENQTINGRTLAREGGVPVSVKFGNIQKFIRSCAMIENIFNAESSQQAADKYYKEVRETCHYCENRGHDSGGLCTNCNKSWFGPNRKTILGNLGAESFEAPREMEEEDFTPMDITQCHVCARPYEYSRIARALVQHYLKESKDGTMGWKTKGNPDGARRTVRNIAGYQLYWHGLGAIDNYMGEGKISRMSPLIIELLRTAIVPNIIAGDVVQFIESMEIDDIEDTDPKFFTDFSDTWEAPNDRLKPERPSDDTGDSRKDRNKPKKPWRAETESSK